MVIEVSGTHTHSQDKPLSQPGIGAEFQQVFTYLRDGIPLQIQLFLLEVNKVGLRKIQETHLGSCNSNGRTKPASGSETVTYTGPSDAPYLIPDLHFFHQVSGFGISDSFP